MSPEKMKMIKRLMSLRWIPILLFVLPASKLLRLVSSFASLWRWIHRRPEEHARRVADIQRQVVETWSQHQRPLCTSRPALFQTTMRAGSYKNRDNSIDVSLCDILWLDEERALCCVEPQVSMGSLTCFLARKGWTLPVVPELDELTVGGLVCGYGIESSSHKHGLFFDCVDSVEVVTGDGRRVVCSREENADFFYAIPWSCGAVAFVVSATLCVHRCERYVRLAYHPMPRDQLVQRLAHESTRKDCHDFVEALLLRPDAGVLLLGDFCKNDGTDNGGVVLPVNHLRSWRAEWFFRQVEHELDHVSEDGKASRIEAVPLFDWYHRHTCALFWEMDVIFPMGNHWLFRNLLGWLMPPSLRLLKMTHVSALQTFYDAAHVAQDFLVPMDKLGEALQRCDELFEIYPVWLCPHQVKRVPGAIKWREHVEGDVDMYVDVGIYGVSRKADRGERFWAPAAVSAFEQWMIKNDSYSALYAEVELSREDFEKMFDRTLHNKVRAEWGAVNVLCDTYEKIKKRRK